MMLTTVALIAVMLSALCAAPDLWQFNRRKPVAKSVCAVCWR